MKISFAKKHKSIGPFEPIALPDFAILTGVNGSGKSHLLEAISNGSATVEGIALQHIVLFNYETFRLDNEPAFNGHQLTSEKEAAWSYFQKHFRNPVAKFRRGIEEDYQAIKIAAQEKKWSLWKAGGTRLKGYKDQLKRAFKSGNHKNNPQAQGIYSLAQKVPVGLDELDRDEFVKRYKPFVLKNDFLPAQLGKIFWDYYLKYRENQLNRFLNETEGKQLPALSDSSFVEQHGQKPWELANKVLETFDSLTFRFESPEGLDVFGNYQLKLIHTEQPGLTVDFQSLSSGERILMALVASIYKASSDRNFPDLLLLDEIDASLHPSMVRNMLAVVKDIFLPAGVKVILVTHSPTTIALAPEDAVFVVNRSGLNRVEKSNLNDALSILTQGFATIDEGLRFLDDIAKSDLTIITEGYNTDYVAKALELYDIADVDVLSGIEDKSGKNQLRTLFEFFARIPHENPVLFVFDPDVSFNLDDGNCTYALELDQNIENRLATKGIENLFPEHLFEDFISHTTLPSGEEHKVFHKGSKRAFERFILGRNNKSDFENFECLINKINEIRSAKLKPT